VPGSAFRVGVRLLAETRQENGVLEVSEEARRNGAPGKMVRESVPGKMIWARVACGD
jgi:hypothetical protein